MDHRRATESKATERYLLGEMSELERHMFEEHYFGCQDCAEDVRTGTVFVANALSVFTERAPSLEESEEDRGGRKLHSRPQVWQERGGWWTDWLRPSSLVPSAAAISLAFITAYQSLVSLPALRRMAVPAMAAPVVLTQATRGELPAIRVNGDGGPAALAIYADGANGQLTFDVRTQEDAVVHSGSGPAPSPGAPMVVFVPSARLKASGTYRVVLRGGSGTLGEYRFTIDRN